MSDTLQPTEDVHKGYLSELREICELLGWCWREFTNRETKSVARIMVFTQVAAGVVSMIRIWSVSLVFNALTITTYVPAFTELVKGILLFCFLSKVGSYMNLRVSLKREKLLAVSSGYIDYRVTEMFLDHSLSTHISEDANLNEANVRKGLEYLSKIQSVLLFQGIQAVLSFVLPFTAIAILAFVIGSPLVFISTIFLVIVFAGYSFYLARSIVKDAGPIDEEWRAYHRYKVERYREPERVKNNAKESYELGQIEKKYKKVSDRDLTYWCWYILRSSDRNALSEDYVNLVLAFSAFQVLFGKMSIGLLSPVYSWSWGIVDALWRLSDIEMQINKSIPAVISLKRALSLPVGIYIPKNPVFLSKNLPLRIEFENVSYRYENKKNGSFVPVLKDISFIMEPGEKVALIGPSGAGKTTIMRLLLRYMDPTSGRITVNGVDLREIDLSLWLNRIGYVRQQAEMLSGDIRYNLVYALLDCGESLTDDNVWEVARPLQIDFGESRLTEGLQTKVGYKGIRLSGGQAQRVMIGAAIMKKPDILLMDEGTSSLDSTTEKLVQKGLSHYLPHGRGALFNAHRLSTVRHICSKFIVLNGGDSEGSRVVAIAESFEKLAAKSETFRQIAFDQDIVLRF